MNQRRNWYECKNPKAKKIIFGILIDVVVKMVNI